VKGNTNEKGAMPREKVSRGREQAHFPHIVDWSSRDVSAKIYPPGIGKKKQKEAIPHLILQRGHPGLRCCGSHLASFQGNCEEGGKERRCLLAEKERKGRKKKKRKTKSPNAPRTKKEGGGTCFPSYVPSPLRLGEGETNRGMRKERMRREGKRRRESNSAPPPHQKGVGRHWYIIRRLLTITRRETFSASIASQVDREKIATVYLDQHSKGKGEASILAFLCPITWWMGGKVSSATI